MIILAVLVLAVCILLLVRWRTSWDWRRSSGYSVHMAWLVVRLLIGLFLLLAIGYAGLTAVLERI